MSILKQAMDGDHRCQSEWRAPSGPLAAEGNLRLEGIIANPNPKFKLLVQVREVLDQELTNLQAVRVDRPVRLPVVLTVEEARLRFAIVVTSH